jgi:prepilin-type N-terminal cleavage/methylation domain-containing protein
MSAQTRNQRSGFSLCELLLVSMILGMTATISVCHYRRQAPAHNVERYAQQIAADLSAARMQAISRCCQMTVTFSPGSPAQYEIWTDKDTDGTRQADEIVLFNLDPAVDVASSPCSISFSPYGRLSTPCAYSRMTISSADALPQYIYVVRSGFIQRSKTALEIDRDTP